MSQKSTSPLGDQHTSMNNTGNLEADVRRMLMEVFKDLRPTPETEDEEKTRHFRNLASFELKNYDGNPDPTVLEKWLRGMEKLFDLFNCPNKLKVGLAVYHLEGQAAIWWETVKEKGEEPEFGWTQLKELMRTKFYPTSLRMQKKREFLALEQGEMSVFEYASKFTELLLFAPLYEKNEAFVVHRFEEGLNLRLRVRLAAQRCKTYQEIYDRAINLECLLHQRDEEQGESDEDDEEEYGGFKRQRYEECRTRTIICFFCGNPGHKSYRCPEKAHNY